MASKPMHTQPFQSGQNSAAKDKGEKTSLKSNMSKVRNAGQPDPLSQALKGRDSYIPSGMHSFNHSKTSKPSGASYNPAGEFGRPKK
jgi:hypothetical protein